MVRSLYEQKCITNNEELVFTEAFDWNWTMASSSDKPLSTMFNFQVLHRTQWPPAPGSQEPAAGNRWTGIIQLEEKHSDSDGYAAPQAVVRVTTPWLDRFHIIEPAASASLTEARATANIVPSLPMDAKTRWQLPRLRTWIWLSELQPAGGVSGWCRSPPFLSSRKSLFGLFPCF